MVAGIVDQPVVGKDDSLCTAGILAERVDIAFGVFPALFLRK